VRLEEAIRYVIPFGAKKGQTIGWVAKHVPHGIADLAKLYESNKLREETREALRSFFAAPTMQKYLKKALGASHNQTLYLLPEGSAGCRCCGRRCHDTMVDVTTRCEQHGYVTLIERTMILKCECGWTSESQARYPIACVGCAPAERPKRVRKK
jgi:hypothetical protein